jgi:hypothetical protein
VKHGVPFDVAFSLNEIDRAAFAIVMGQFEGGKFDWDAMQFRDPK